MYFMPSPAFSIRVGCPCVLKNKGGWRLHKDRTKKDRRLKKMAKRFYDTGLVDQEWYMNLSPKHKALYMHLLCKCDVAGVFEVNCRMMSAYLNDEVTREDVFGKFGGRTMALPGSDSKGILVDFVSFQCGGCLNPKVKAHQAILKRIAELNITVNDLQAWSKHGLRLESGERTDQENMDNPKKRLRVSPVKDKSENDIENMFECFWMNYPRHDSKKLAHARFVSIMKEAKGNDERNELLGMMLYSIKNSRRSEQWQKDGGQFIPMPTTWLNQRRWEDEGISTSMSPNASREQADGVAHTLAATLKM